MELPRLYYTLPELAEKWGCAENDLLHLASTGEIELSVKYRGWALDQSVCHILLIKDHIQLHPHSVEALMDGVIKIDSARFKGKPIMLPVDEFNLILLKQWASEQDPLFDLVKAISFKIRGLKDLRIFPGEVSRVEAKFPRLAAGGQAGTTDVAESVDDPVIWTWPKMERFGPDRKTITKRAGLLGIEFLTRPPKRGKSPEKGLKESDLRRIIINK